MADDDEDLDELPPKPSKLPMIIAAVVALVLGAGGGFGASVMFGGSAEAAEEDGEGGEEAADENAPDPDNPDDPAVPDHAIVSLGKFTLNLRGASGGRILRFQVDVEVDYDDQEEMTLNMAILRDGVILLTSDYTYADVDGLDGKLRLRDELPARLNTLLETPKIRRVFFTEFMVQ